MVRARGAFRMDVPQSVLTLMHIHQAARDVGQLRSNGFRDLPDVADQWGHRGWRCAVCSARGQSEALEDDNSTDSLLLLCPLCRMCFHRDCADQVVQGLVLDAVARGGCGPAGRRAMSGLFAHSGRLN
eukprot:627815-Alexandrium_andersonii.AAC.1